MELNEITANITLVRPENPDIPLAKHFYLDRNGQLRAEPYPLVKTFLWKQVSVGNIQDLHKLVLDYYRNRRVAMLFGVPAQGISNPTTRTKEHFPEPQEGRRVIAFDIDGLSLPEGIEPCSREALEYARSQLPPAFQTASFVAEWSNSAGIRKPDGAYLKRGINLHAFFFADTPVQARLLEAYIQEHCLDSGLYALGTTQDAITVREILDLSVFRAPNQLLYTAEPLLDEGVVCELRPEDRVVFIPGAADSVTVPPLTDDLPRRVKAKKERIRDEAAVTMGLVKTRKIVRYDGHRHYYDCWQSADPASIPLGRRLLELREVGDGNIRVLYMEGEKSPGSWRVMRRSPWLAKRYGDDLEVPLDELCPDAVEVLRELGWITEIREAEAEPEPEPDKEKIPTLEFGAFTLDEQNGIVYTTYTSKGIPIQTWVASPIVVDALVRDFSAQGWSYLLKLWDPDGQSHSVRVTAAELTSDNFRRTLMEHGAKCNTNIKGKELLGRYIQEFPATERRLLVENTGWVTEECTVFALPDEVFGNVDDAGGADFHMAERLAEYLSAYGQAGTLEEWRDHVASYCRGNQLLVFALSAAFLPPLLRPTAMDNVGIHFRGASSLGKSRLMMVAASVWGDPAQYINSWRTTDNALETLAAARTDALLALDEIGALDAAAAGDAIYMLGNGQGKARMRADTSARPIAKFRLVFMSSGELTLNGLLRRAGRRSMAGHEVRLLDVRADAGCGMGIFQSLNGFQSSKELVDHLEAASRRFYGTPIRAFLTQLLASAEELEQTAAQLSARIKLLTAQWQIPGGDNQVTRAARQFAAVAAAGELAISWGILPLQTGDAEAAARWCFDAWLEERGGAESTDVLRAYEALVEKLHLYGTARFEWGPRSGQPGIGESVRVPNPSWGYGKWIRDNDDVPEFEFWIPVAIFESEFCPGVTRRQLAEYLVAKGFMERPVAINRRVTGVGSIRVYAIKGAILAGEVPARQPEGTGGGTDEAEGKR